MLCEKCKIREANIKYTEIINGVKTEHNLCAHCAREMDFGQYAAMLDGEFPLGRLLSGLLGLENDQEETEERAKVVCPTCGTSFDDFVENSRFGCPDCYGVFDLFINDKIKQLQGSESHKGKHPRYQSKFEKEHPKIMAGNAASADAAEEEEPQEMLPVSAANSQESRRIRELKKLLQEALQAEDYEKAAQCRDEIRSLEQAAGTQPEKEARQNE